MIKSFRCKETEKVFGRRPSRKFSSKIQRIALRKLLLIDAAEAIKDLQIPLGDRLEKLSGRRKKQHSIRINEQWRICFEWKQGDAYKVEIVDYH